MKVEINFVLKFQGPGKISYKSIDLPFVPYKGMEIYCDGAPDFPREVTNVVLHIENCQEPYLKVDLKMIQPDCKDDYGSRIEYYKNNGWTLSGE